MPDTSIVTIVGASASFEVDLEIPANLPFADFKEQLLGILKILDVHGYLDDEDYCLLYKNNVLAENETLASVGAFDGSRLVVTKKMRSENISDSARHGRAWQVWQSFKNASSQKDSTLLGENRTVVRKK
ncbi:MAG: EsaB/YukD family protein [Synergistaceae bacterium]|jgi:hypothetical protein|nr:EsaB/YukD family protein [Synergistaceae bacterium]